jgi:23S rRNA pseudouridine1911/1915/1917 synthase
MAEMGHPILVDSQYARSFRCNLFVQRPMLHAHRLGFNHPITGAPIALQSPVPDDFRQTAHQLGIVVRSED